MAKFKALLDCRDEKNNKSYEQAKTYNVTVKEIEDFEKRLEKKGYELPFFERIKK